MNRSLGLLLFSFPFLLACRTEAESQTRARKEHNLDHLAAVQADAVQPDPFTSDGCNGGLSKLWEETADRVEMSRDGFGSLPPWQK